MNYVIDMDCWVLRYTNSNMANNNTTLMSSIIRRCKHYNQP